MRPRSRTTWPTRLVLAGWGAGLAWLTMVAPVRAEVRVGYIDSARIWVEYKDAQEAQQRFDRQVEGWRNEAAEKEKLVTQMRLEVRDQGPVLSALRLREKQSALDRLTGEYETFVQEVWGPNGRASQENVRASEEIIEVVRRTVEKLAAQRGLELVLDATSGFIIYANKTMDMTNDVLAELNANAAAAAAKR